ncbi:MAG: diguanylate cyclase [Anaerolineales bacterium]
MQRLGSYLAKLSSRSALLISLGLVLGVGILDYLLIPALSLSFFYLIPISTAAWYSGRRAAIGLSILSGMVAGLEDVYPLQGATSTPFVLVWATTSRLAFFLVVALLVASLRNALDRERVLARTDYLTGLGNARSFFESASLELDRARRYGRPISVMYVDLDDFKVINDELGHVAGDEVLRLTGAVLRGHLRSTDLVGRLGGDEFAILMPETGFEGAGSAAAKVRAALRQELARQGWSLTISVGVLTCEEMPASVERLIGQVDSLMYAVKRSGKDGILQKRSA